MKDNRATASPGSSTRPMSEPPRASTTDLVDHHMPGLGDAERELRQRLHRASSIALAKAHREPNASARELYWLAAQACGAWTFKRTDDLGTLKRVLAAVNQMFLAADNLLQVEGPTGGHG